MIPNLCYKIKIPDKIPNEMQQVVDELKKSKSKEECLRRAYEVLTKKYRGYRFRTYLKIWLVFVTDLEKLWQRTDFLHCHTMNYLLRALLIKSGWFSEDDIKLKYSLVRYISLHQYLEIKVALDKFINVDIWNANYGKGLGDYAHGFH